MCVYTKSRGEWNYALKGNAIGTSQNWTFLNATALLYYTETALDTRRYTYTRNRTQSSCISFVRILHAQGEYQCPSLLVICLWCVCVCRWNSHRLIRESAGAALWCYCTDLYFRFILRCWLRSVSLWAKSLMRYLRSFLYCQREDRL